MRSRQKVLDATVEIIESEGFDAVSIAAVANRASVSRQTIYSIFGTREDLVSQAVVGLALTALGDITLRLEATTTPFDYIVELLVAGRGAVLHPAVIFSGAMALSSPLRERLEAAFGCPVIDVYGLHETRPIAAPKSAVNGDGATAAVMTSAGVGDIEPRGARRRVHATGLGAPFSFMTVTTASPVARPVSTAARS